MHGITAETTGCGRTRPPSGVGRRVAPKSYVLPEPVNMALSRKRVFMNEIKVSALR